MSRPVRVLQVLRVMNRAGIETWLMHLLRHFDRREVAIDFLLHTDQPGAYDAEIRDRGAQLLYCHGHRNPWAYARDFVRALREHGPYDVVHSHNYFFSGLDMRLAAFAGVDKRITHLHPVRDLGAQRSFRSLYRGFMGRWIREYSNLVFAPSEASLEAFSKHADLSGRRSVVVRNCVDTPAWLSPRDRADARRKLGLPSDLPIIIYVARFEPHKNHLLVAELAEQLDRMDFRAHFVIAGTDGSARRSFEARIASRGDFSVFIDKADLSLLLQCSDLFFFPSTEEGFGVVAIEAAAAGLPVVATNLPGIREACCPCQRQFMFAQNDAQSAAQNVRSILSNPQLAATLQREGREWATQFSVEAVADQLREMYGVTSREDIAPSLAARP